METKRASVGRKDHFIFLWPKTLLMMWGLSYRAQSVVGYVVAAVFTMVGLYELVTLAVDAYLFVASGFHKFGPIVGALFCYWAMGIVVYIVTLILAGSTGQTESMGD